MNKFLSRFEDWITVKCQDLYDVWTAALAELEANFIEELKKAKERFLNE